MLARNAYLPVAPRIAARWGAFSALLGGFLGMTHSVAATLAFTVPLLAWWESLLTGQIFFVATYLSILGMFGLYGTLVARSGRPDGFALAGAAFGALSVASILAEHAWTIAMFLGWLRPPGDPGESFYWWIYSMRILEVLGMGGCVVGLSLLGVSVFRMRLFGRLSALPFVVATLWPASIALLFLMRTSGMHWMHYVSWLSGTLPFLGAALSGWVLLKIHSANQLAAAGGASSGVAEEMRGTARRAAGSTRRTTSEGWMGRQRASATKAAKEQELLEAMRRKGQVTAVEAALETSLSVEEAERMLSELAAKGHLEVRVRSGRLLYALWQPDAPE